MTLSRLWVCCLVLILPGVAVAGSLAKLSPGQEVTYVEVGSWNDGVVKQVRGNLVLVQNAYFEKQVYWVWVARDQVRAKGETHAGPGLRYRIRETLSTRSIEKALAAAQHKLAVRLASDDEAAKPLFKPVELPASALAGDAEAPTPEAAAEPVEPKKPAARPVFKPLRPGQKVSMVRGSNRWRDEAIVKRVSGSLVLVHTGPFEGQDHWQWVARDQLRAPGETHDGPAFRYQINERLVFSSQDEALAEALEELRERLAEQPPELTRGLSAGDDAIAAADDPGIADDPVAAADDAPPPVAAVDMPDPELGQAVRVHDGRDWEDGVVQQLAGGLVLISPEKWQHNTSFWTWVRREQVRMPGETHEPPVKANQLDERLFRDSIEQGLIKAQRAMQDMEPVRASAVLVKMTQRTLPRETPFRYKPSDSVPTIDKLSLKLPGELDKFGTVRYLSGDNPALAVSRLIGFIQTESVAVDIVTLDDQSVTTIKIPKSYRMADVSGDRQKLLARSVGSSVQEKSRLQMFDIVDAGVEPVKAVRPFGDGEISSASFIGERDRVMVRGENNRLQMFNSADLDGGWQMTLEQGRVGVRPDEQVLAVVVGSRIHLIDLDGLPLATLDGTVEKARSLTFNVDGTKLAASTQDHRLMVWDLTTGQRTLNVLLPRLAVNLRFIHRDLLLNGTNLIDPTTGGTVWQYKLNMTDRLLWVGDTLLRFDEGRGNGPYKITSLRPPHPDALLAARTVTTRQVLDEGSSVKLSVKGLPGGQRAAVEKRLTEQLAARGITVDAGAEVEVRVISEKGETVQQEYEEGFGFRKNSVGTATIRRLKHRYEIRGFDGEILYQRAGDFLTPFNIRREEGQTLQGAIDAARQRSYVFFDRIVLPEALTVTSSPIRESPMW
jgi:hypothetical protein